MGLKSWFRDHVADVDPNPEPANPRWAEALLDGQDESKGSNR